jgi:hypothetical protein
VPRRRYSCPWAGSLKSIIAPTARDLGKLPRITTHPRPSADEEWERTREVLFASFRDGVTRAQAAECAELDEGWVLLREAVERGRLLDERAAAHREAAIKQVEGICSSAADEAEEILARVRTTVGEILAQARVEAMEITAAARQRIPLTVGSPNPALAGKEVRRAARLLLDQAKADANGLLSNARQRLEVAEEREALVHAREESANSRAASLGLLEAGLAARGKSSATANKGCTTKRSNSLPSRTGSTGSGKPLRPGRAWSARQPRT